MTETPFFLMNGNRSIFAMWHHAGSDDGAVWVFSHPILEEKLWTHRVFVEFARYLVARGDSVLRFDFTGTGDSDGEFSESSVETSISDLQCAIDEARRRSGASTVNLMGLRFGATIAALLAERSTDIGRLVLWSPIVDGNRYMQELLRINLATQTAVYKELRHDRAALVEMMRQGQTVNVDGYEMGFEFYAESTALQLGTGAKRHAGPCLIVQIDRQTARLSPDLQQLATTYPHPTLVPVQEEPFWKEIATSYLGGAPRLFAATSDWLAGKSQA